VLDGEIGRFRTLEDLVGSVPLLVAAFAALAIAVLGATIRSTLLRSSSATSPGSRSGLPSAVRTSMTMLRPSA